MTVHKVSIMQKNLNEAKDIKSLAFLIFFKNNLSLLFKNFKL